MEDIKSRLLMFIDYKGVSRREFCRAIEVSATFLANTSEIVSGKVVKIISVFPEISLVWLLTGEGEMIKTQPADDPCHSARIVDFYNDIISSQQRIIENLTETLKDLTTHI